MRIGPFGAWEILIILVAMILVFGPRRLPEMAKGLGRSVRAFRSELHGRRLDVEQQPPTGGRAAAPEASSAGELLPPIDGVESMTARPES